MAQPSLEPQQPPIQARPGGPDNSPKSDQTVDVTKGTRLVLSNNAGEVVVRSWERDQVRIQATHGARETITAETTDMTLRIRTQRASGSRGPGGLVDYQITVPRWMPVNLSGTYLDATIEGTTAEVTVETVHGNARVVGGNGAVSLRSVEGVITVDKASGRVQATTVNEGIRITNSTGEITAETTNGNIFIDNAQTSNLEAFTVNGEVTFNGTIRDNGVYKLGTHNGDIRVGLGAANNATDLRAHVPGRLRGRLPGAAAGGPEPAQRQQAVQLHARQRQRAHRAAVVRRRHRAGAQDHHQPRRRAAPPPRRPRAAGAAAAAAAAAAADADAEAAKAARAWITRRSTSGRSRSPPVRESFEQQLRQGISRRTSRSTSNRTSRRASRKQFEKNFEKNFEKDFEKEFEESLKSWKMFSNNPTPKAKIR